MSGCTHSDQTAEKMSAGMLTFGSYLQKYAINWLRVFCNYFVKDVATIYDSHMNAH